LTRTEQDKPILEMTEITKTFPGVVALDQVNFNLLAGDIHALVGENGAGKSTLIKILGGVYSVDSGEIEIDGKPAFVDNPITATKLGVAIIHQELNVIPGLSVADNVMLGAHPTTGLGFINEKELEEETQKILDDLGVNLSPNEQVRSLPIAAAQLILIAQALARKPRILVLDEPTAALGEADIDHLFDVLKRLSSQGVGIIYISHKLDEVFCISDRISVLRDGKYAGTRITSATNHQEIVHLMVGRELREMYPKQEVEIGEVILDVQNFESEGSGIAVSFQVRKGEILGIFGLLGAGRTRLVKALFGAEKGIGKIIIDGKEIQVKAPADAYKVGIGLLPLERKSEGLVMPLSIENNLLLGTFPKYVRTGFMRDEKMSQAADHWIDTLHIISTGRSQITRDLSGGNQQKVVLGRLLESQVKVLILNSPTRGIDVGAKVEIYNLMGELCSQGKAVIFVTSELPELLGLSDRIIVMSSGQITGEFPREEADQEKIMHAAIGLDKLTAA
jgi:ribose transport system ATP-binding protein